MALNKKAPGYFRRRGDASWRWEVSVNGKRHSIEIPNAPDLNAAQKWARAKYPELERLRERHARGLDVSRTIGDLIAYYEAERMPLLNAQGTRDAYADCLKPIKAWLAEQHPHGLMLSAFYKADVLDFMDWRRKHRSKCVRRGNDRQSTWVRTNTHPVANQTLIRECRFFHGLIEVAREREWCEVNPVALVKFPKADGRRKVILDDAQYDALLRGCDALTGKTDAAQVKLYLLFCAETGVRSNSEALWLRWEDINFEEESIVIESGRNGHRVKGGRPRFVPMTNRLKVALRAHFVAHRFAEYDGKRPEYVFHHTRTRRQYTAGDRVKSFQGSVRNAAKHAQIPLGWVKHDLRHRRVTTWLEKDKNVTHVQAAVGHSDVRTTMGYSHLTTKHLRALRD